MKSLYIDMDGVLADFDFGFHRQFNLNHHQMEEDLMWQIINASEYFFLDLPIYDRAIEFMDSIKEFNPIILTACPSLLFERAAKQKKCWIQKYFGNIPFIPVWKGKHKGLYMNQEKDVLVDDMQKNIDAWHALGGYGIKHNEGFYNDTLSQIKSFMNDPDWA